MMLAATTEQLQQGALAVPPHNLTAELGVLGGLMLDNSVWPAVHGQLSARDFYRADHGRLFNAIGSLLSAGGPADVITVSEYLRSKSQDAEFDLTSLALMARDTPSAANVGVYARIVRDKAILRELISVAGKIRDFAMLADADSKTAVSKSETAIFEIAQRSLRGKKGFARVRDVLRDVVDTMQDNYDKPSDGVLGVSSGFVDLDGYTSGFGGGDLVVIAARPAMGKTAFAMNIAESVAVGGKAVAVFSMEMQAEQLGQRLLSSASGVGLKLIRESWKLQDNHWPLITTGIHRLGESPLFIDDAPGLTIADIRARCMRLNTEIRTEFASGIGMIVIDYLQLMGSDQDRAGNRNNEIEDITRGLKRMAKEFDIPVVILSQLNRELERRPNKRPTLSDLRDSGGIEQDADMVIFLYRDETYNPDSQDRGIAEAIIGKQRNGPLGTVRLAFDGECTRFRSLIVGGY